MRGAGDRNMKGSINKKTLQIGALIVTTVLLILFVGIFQIVPPSHEPSFYIKIGEVIDEDHIRVNALCASDSVPLPNVTVAVYEYGIERLLSGPQMTGEAGYAIVEIPRGYDECFDIVAEYNGERRTLTVDKRSLLVRLGDTLGPLGIAVVSTILGVVLGLLGGYHFGRRGDDTVSVLRKPKTKR